MEEHDMLENKMFIVDCTGLTVEEQVIAAKKLITWYNMRQEKHDIQIKDIP